MAKLELLPYNLIIIINKLLENDNLVKMINDNTTTPLLSVLPANRKTLFMTKIFPYPVSPNIATEQSQIRVYYPDTQLKNAQVIEDSIIHFDVVVHNNLYLIKDATNKTTFRPDALIMEITTQFEQSVNTVGKLQFVRRMQLVVNPDFQMIRLFAKMMTIS